MKAEFLPKTPDGRRYRLFEEMGEVLQAFGKAGRFGLESRHPDGGPTNRELILAELGDLRHAIGAVESDVGPSSPRSILASESARQVVDGVCNDRGWAYREKLVEAITRAISTEVARGDALAASLGAAVSRAECAEARAREVEGQLEAAEARASDAEDRAEAAEVRADAAERSSLLKPANSVPAPDCHCQPGRCAAPHPEWCRNEGKRDHPDGWQAVREMRTADLHGELDRRMRKVHGAHRTLHPDPKQAERMEALAAEIRNRMPREEQA